MAVDSSPLVPAYTRLYVSPLQDERVGSQLRICRDKSSLSHDTKRANDTAKLVEIIREAQGKLVNGKQWGPAESMVTKMDLRSPLDCPAKTFKYSKRRLLKGLKNFRGR